MRVLVLGGGGREHAIAWKLAQSRLVTEVASAPGNPGLAELGPTIGVDITEPAAVVEQAAGADLVVIGPEAPLAAGVADALDAAAIPVFGPSRAAARLESSKAFAKQVMTRAAIPTGTAAVFDDREAALGHLLVAPGPFVVKADGLAAGKGVLVTDDRAEATRWVHRCFDGDFGAAGETVIIEEHLSGEEVSVFGVCAGGEVLAFEPARDYKRLGDGGTGPNTGGMGCYSPVTGLAAGLVDDVVEQVMRPAIAQLAAEGVPYRGFLYAGMMLTADGPKVLEFNCRLGDPETQVVLPRLGTDLAALLAGAAAGTLPDRLHWSVDSAVDVVLASPGYPDAVRKGASITGLKRAADVAGVTVFHAGTAYRDGELVTAGGRVLNVVGVGPDLAAARARAYEAAELIEFEGMQMRSDIAGGGT